MTASPRRPRIGVDGRWLSEHYPGIGRYVYNLLAALAAVAQDEEMAVVSTGEPARGRFDLSQLQGLAPHPIPGGERPSLRGQLAARALKHRAPLDLFHATYFPGALGIPRPTVVSVHDLIPLQLPETIRDPSRRLLYRLILKRAVSSAARILTPTDDVKRQLVEQLGVPGSRIVATPYAAAPHLTAPSPAELESVRERLALPERYLLYLGTNKPHKNLRRLLEAWAVSAGRSTEDVRLVLAGPVDPSFPAPLEIASALEVEGVVATGRVREEDLPALLGGAEALLQPSLGEGFGLSVLEAMACGTAVACSAIPPLLEVAGDAALTFEPLDVEAIAATIRQLAGDPGLRADLARRGAEQARRFSWERTARLTMHAYHEALGQ